MRIPVLLSVAITVLLACSNEQNTDSTLSKAPYNKLTDSIELAPTDAGLYYRRGALLYQNEEFALAQKDLQQAWAMAPVESHALSLATILAKKNTDSALLFLQTAIQRLPESVALQVSLARGYQQKGEAQKALTQSNAIIAKYPNNIDALVLKAELLQGLDQQTEALQTLEKAYSLAPFDAELVHNLAFAYAEAKNAKVLALSDSLIRADINAIHAEPYYFKGLYFVNTGNNTEAIKQLDAAIQHDYYFLDAYMEKGQLYYNLKQYPEAVKTFQLATTVTPTFADAYYWMGKTKEALGDKKEAKLDYQRAYGLDKSLAEAKQAADRL
jgi:tetratricopeptide (TPR) repeat protein